MSTTITEGILNTYDALRKFTSEVNIMDLQEALRERTDLGLKLNKLVMYNYELFEMGKFVGEKYIREHQELLILRDKVVELQKEIEILKKGL